MPLKSVKKQRFEDSLSGKKFRHLQSQIQKICDKLCENPRSCHAHQLHGELDIYWSADIPKSGRGSERIIFRIHDAKNEDIPIDEIWFIDIQDTHST
jgi:hypothetical protein